LTNISTLPLRLHTTTRHYDALTYNTAVCVLSTVVRPSLIGGAEKVEPIWHGISRAIQSPHRLLWALLTQRRVAGGLITLRGNAAAAAARVMNLRVLGLLTAWLIRARTV